MGRALRTAFLAGSKVMLMLLVQAPHSENQELERIKLSVMHIIESP